MLIRVPQTLALFGLSLLLIGCTPPNEQSSDTLSEPFFGVSPSDSVQVLAPGIVSTSLFEYNGTFSPVGDEFYYTVSLPNRGQVVFMKLGNDNTWSEPKFASFSSEFSEVDPLFSPDGSRLYFTSNRPTSDSTRAGQNHIWYVEKVADGWSEPQLVTLTEIGDFYSSLTHNGDIYFNRWSTGDIYKGMKTDSTYTVERLPDVINLGHSVGDPFISPNEDYLIFRGNNMENSVGAFDLYISFRIDNEWTEPLNLGEPINSTAREICPFITADGSLFIFASNRQIEDFKTAPLHPIATFRDKSQSFDNGAWNIYYTSTAFIDRLKAQSLKR